MASSGAVRLEALVSAGMLVGLTAQQRCFCSAASFIRDARREDKEKTTARWGSHSLWSNLWKTTLVAITGQKWSAHSHSGGGESTRCDQGRQDICVHLRVPAQGRSR